MGVLAVAGQKVPASFPNQYYGFADTTVTTVTQATQTPLTTSYSIPANEPVAGSAYEVLFGGSGTWGATQQIIAFTFVIGGVVVLANISIGGQAFSASAAIRWAGRALIVWNAIGASGNVIADYMININQIANNINPPATVTQANLQAANAFGFSDCNGAVSAAIDTTAAVPVVLKCAWGSTTGAPTISNRHTLFRKVA